MQTKFMHGIAPLVIMLVVASMLIVGCKKEEHFQDNQTWVEEVTNPITGRTWMDRNLGASRVATRRKDTQAYGDLFQWGRAADGHQRRNSGTTSTLSISDTPGA